MQLDNYSDLQTAIATYAFRTGDQDFTAAVPAFIALAEARMNNVLRLREQIKSATIDMSSGTGALPADYLEYIRVRRQGDPARVLEAVATTWGDSQYPNAAGGDAAFFAIEGSTLRPFPPATGDLDLEYYAKIPALSAAASTNWLLSKSPGVYLYGALLEAQPFILDDQRIATFGTLYEQAVTDLRNADQRARYGRAQARTRMPTP